MIGVMFSRGAQALGPVCHCNTSTRCQPNLTLPTTMLLAKLLLLPMAVASSVTLYVSSVPVSDNTALIPSPIPLAQIEYDADQSVGTLSSYTPPTGSYASDHLLRVGLQDTGSGAWRGIVTSAASFADEYHKKFVIHVDEKGEPFHVGFGTSAKRAGGDVEVEIIKRSSGPKPVLNKPIVLNAEGKIDSKEPEKSFLQKCVSKFYCRTHQFSANQSADTGGPSRCSWSFNWSQVEEMGNSRSTLDNETYRQGKRPRRSSTKYAVTPIFHTNTHLASARPEGYPCWTELEGVDADSQFMLVNSRHRPI
jgi:hypothetical protein